MIFNNKYERRVVRLRVSVLACVMLFFCRMYAAKEAYAQAQDPDLLYRAKCTSCHRLYPPQKHTYQKFQAYVIRYGKGLSDEERRRILEYLKENAKQG